MKGTRQYRRSDLILVVFAATFSTGCTGENPPAVQPVPSEETRTYEVDGETTVAGVAKAFGTEVADILQLNPALPDSEVLKRGTSLRVAVPPDEQPTVPTLEPDVPESSAYSGTFHLLLDLNDASGSWLARNDEPGTNGGQSGNEANPAQSDDTNSAESEDSAGDADPQLFLVEHFRLTSFVSDYGTGRIIKTFSLMPGEKAELTISSFTRETLKANEASSILDSFSDETLKEFERSVRAEQTSSSTTTTSTETRASASGAASWGWGKAEASGSYANAASESRARFANNVASAAAKNTARASAARQIEINTNVERSRETEKTETAVRTVENINSDRTLNFVFYQMNQAYVSLIHLTEIELGYDDGRGNLVVVPLYQVRSLLNKVVKADRVDDAQRAIFAALREIRDHRGREATGFIAEDSWLRIGDEDNPSEALDMDKAEKVNYLRVNHDYVSGYEQLGTGREYFVDGVIVAVQPLVLRTDGIYVESLLGQTSAWSPHTEKIKAEELRELQIRNDLLQKGR